MCGVSLPPHIYIYDTSDTNDTLFVFNDLALVSFILL